MTTGTLIVAVSLVLLEAATVLPQTQITSEEFAALKDADKRVVLASSFKEFQRAARNLQARSVTHIYNVEYRNGITGRVLKDMDRNVCEIRRRDGSHWSSVDWFLPDDKPDQPNEKIVTTIDSDSGEAKSIAKHAKQKNMYGAIDTQEDSLSQGNGLFYWLIDAQSDKLEDYPISYILKHQDAIKFEGSGTDRKGIRVSLRFERSNGTRYEDVRKLWLDPQRGFMPVRMERHWQYATNPPLYSEEDTDIKQLKQVEGVWFPTNFTLTVTGRLSTAEGYATVYETTVEQIKLGGVTKDDLQVRFPNGIQVHDRIRGAWFVASDTVQSAPAIKPTSETKGGLRKWLIIANIVAIAGLAAIIMLRRRRLGIDRVPSR